MDVNQNYYGEENWPPGPSQHQQQQQQQHRPSTPFPHCSTSTDPNIVFFVQVDQGDEFVESAAPPSSSVVQDAGPPYVEEDWESLEFDQNTVPNFEWDPKKKDESKEGRKRSHTYRHTQTPSSSMTVLYHTSAHEKRHRRRKKVSSSLLRSIMKSPSALYEDIGNSKTAGWGSSKGKAEMECQDLVLDFKKFKLDEGNHNQ